MKRFLIVSVALVTLAGSGIMLYAYESETFTGVAARSGTYKRPLLDVDGKRYELKASDKADASVAELLDKFSKGDTGTYVVTGTRGTVNGGDGIIIDSIAPAAMALPGAGAVAAVTNVAQGNALAGAAQTTPTVTSSVVTVGSERYLVYDYDDMATRNHTVVIPEGLKAVRGLLVNACYAGGDSRQDWTICEYYRQFMHLHGFAYVGCTSTVGSPGSAPKTYDTPSARHRGIFQAFEDGMQVIATASQHPEMVNAPYVGVGFSAGGGFSFYLMVYAPERTIAAASYCAPYIFKRRLTSPPSPAVLNVPSICITGELEHFNAPFAPGVDPGTASARIHEVFLPYRPKGAKYAWMERQGGGHEYDENRQDVLGMPLLDAAVRARYPKDGDVTKGPIKLLPIDYSAGWIADNTTWKSGLTKICPAREFKGDLGHSSWLMNEDIAFIYRAYSTYDKPLTITAPGNCWPSVPALDAGASVPIVVDAGKFPDWKTMAFYDGANKLAEITRGPTQFTATNLTPGYHVFSVLATDGHGNIRTADPKMVVVRPPDRTPVFAEKVTVVRTLPAQVGTNFKSNIDLSGAVGLKHVVSFNGGGFVVYDKATGKVVERLSQSDFWTKRVAASYSMDPQAMYNDPKLIYDPLSDRWFATVAPNNISYLAVSTSGDPTKLWRGVILPLPTVDPGLTTGTDKNGLYICAANGNPDSQQALDCLAIPIADATNPDGPVLTNAQSFTNLHFMAYPAMDVNPNKAPDAPAILMNNEFKGFTGSGKLYLYKITWSGNKASISAAQTIALSRTYDTSRPECEQPGSAPKLRASSAVRTESIVVHGGSVFGCHAAKLTPKSRLGIVWYEVRIEDGALIQEGFIDDPRCDYLYPSLALDRAGNLGIGCSRVSQTEYPSIYVMMRAATDPPNTMRPPVLVIPGTTAYTWGTGNPTWCHYSSTCIDPSDPSLLWTCQPFSASTVHKEWCTAWAAFQLSEQEQPTADDKSAALPLANDQKQESRNSAGSFNVKDFGARGDGVTDDRPGIQAAIDALTARGGGVLRMPKGTYLLNSYRPAVHPWGFYNLLLGSHIHIEGEPGATLLQGEKGRAPLPQGATMVMNSVLVVGTPMYAVVTCQNTEYNGGFYSLRATVADTGKVELTRAADATHFAAGDYVAIYEKTTGDVLPTEMTRVSAMTAEGELTLAAPLARSFSTPSIANVTKLITSDVSLKNLKIQGGVPLTIMETYGFSAEGCEILADANVGESNAVTTFNCNTMRCFRFVRNLIGYVGPWYGGIELPQRNSQDGLFEENTIHAASVGFGEYGAHWRFLQNHMWLYPGPETAVAVSITGLDVLFSGNDVHCGKLTGGEGWACVLTDFYAPGDYAPYVGQVRITDNTIECDPGAAYGLLLRSRDPVITGNRLRVRGSGAAIRFDGDYIAASITNNDITVDTGAGIMLETGSHNACTIAHNRISATDGSVAIHIASPSKTGRQRIEQNTISGFAQGVVREPGN